jgi:hypothetical protein
MSALLLSPRQLATAIGVSESSLKRWADAGKLAVSRTDGGHRRIAVSEAVRFIRDTGATVVRPDLLGLGEAGTGAAPGSRARGKRRGGGGDGFVDALLSGDAPAARAILSARFLGGESIAALGDGVVADAITHIDELHGGSARDELAARGASDALTHALAALRAMCNVAADAPVAVGGAGAATDAPHVGTTLRSAVVATVLAGEGLRVIDLGAHVAASVLRTATAVHAPAITWLVDGDTVHLNGGSSSGFDVRTLAEVAAFARGLRAR